jgi:hypothetical protein
MIEMSSMSTPTVEFVGFIATGRQNTGIHISLFDER